MQLQEAFDKIWAHAKAMKRPSRNPGSGQNPTCLYAGPDGSSCFVGCLIPRELAEEWDAFGAKGGGSITTLCYRDIPGARVLVGDDRETFSALQWLHDDKRNWTYDGFKMDVLREFAMTRGLTVPND